METEECKMRTYINMGLHDYVSTRFQKGAPVRAAVIPFDVPETFAPTGSDSVNFGRQLALKFISEMHRTAELPILELFNRDSWPGKHDEFFSGNYTAIQLARDAGYDLVVIGYFERPTNDRDLNIYTKLIDVTNGMTIWYAKTYVSSNSRDVRRGLADYGLATDHREFFAFPERIDLFAACTVDHLINNEPVPQ